MDTPTRAPGPWFVTLVDGDGILAPPPYLSVGPHPDDTADAFAFSGHYRGMVPDHEWARFRLLAAAPDLLAACEAAHSLICAVVMGFVMGKKPGPDAEAEVNRVTDLLAAAIAKAGAA
jgi:hypothetical protein